MRVYIDKKREILDTLTRNKSRSLLTGFGVFWGVFMLVLLIGGGQGLKELLSNNFEGFATNTTIVFAQNTTKAYKGFRKGRQWDMTDKDILLLEERIPQLETVTPMVFGSNSQVTWKEKKTSGNIKGLKANYVNVQAPKLLYGRYINEMDEKNGRKVCVIGKKIYKDLFGGGIDPCGERIKVGSVYYQIVGVDYNSSGINIGGNSEEAIVIPFNLCRNMYGYGNTIHSINITGRGNIEMKTLEPQIREVIGRNHSVDPEDTHAISTFNTQVMFGIMDSLFKGVNFLVWLVGLGTILAGAIGVSNIMMVTVKERTTEIGIRRAIGATPNMILSQIITESLLLTIVAGMSGILFGVLILQAIELGMTEDGILAAHFQIKFWTAIGAAMLVGMLGMAAGLAPAFRAMAIKPVEAMREE